MSREQKCGTTIWNLLLFSENNPALFAPAFIQELERARDCDDLHPKVKDLREKYERKLGKETYQKIIDYKSDKLAIEKATSIVSHYSCLNKEILIQELNFLDTCKYWFNHKPISMLNLAATAGSVAFVKSGWTFLRSKK